MRSATAPAAASGCGGAAGGAAPGCGTPARSTPRSRWSGRRSSAGSAWSERGARRDEVPSGGAPDAARSPRLVLRLDAGARVLPLPSRAVPAPRARGVRGPRTQRSPPVVPCPRAGSPRLPTRHDGRLPVATYLRRARPAAPRARAVPAPQSVPHLSLSPSAARDAARPERHDLRPSTGGAAAPPDRRRGAVKILALDLGTKTGWAYASTPKIIESG